MDDMEKKESVESEASEKAAEEVVTEEKAADETVEVSTEAPKGSHVDEEGILEYDDSNASKFDKFFGVTKFGSSIRIRALKAKSDPARILAHPRNDRPTALSGT